MTAAEHPARQLGHRAGEGDAAPVEQRDPVADALHLVEMMRRQEHRRAVRLQATNHVEKFLRRMRVECGRRLVEDRNARALHQHLGEAESLAHALRVGADPVAAYRRETDALHCVGEACVDLITRQSGEPAGIGEVVEGRETVIEADLIGHVADPPLDL